MQRRQGKYFPQYMKNYFSLGIDIGSTTVKAVITGAAGAGTATYEILFSDYERHYANIQETLAGLLKKAREKLGAVDLHPTITGSGVRIKRLSSNRKWR